MTSSQELLTDSKEIAKDCIICQEAMINPIELDCGHEYCYTCIKGTIINIGTECPLCRKQISSKFKNLIFEAPEKLCKNLSHIETDYIWIYSGKDSGWWYFDSKSNDEVEHLYQLYHKQKLTPEINYLSICGLIFTFNFKKMEQINKKNKVVRHIQRLTQTELNDFMKNNQIKGICGIKKI